MKCNVSRWIWAMVFMAVMVMASPPAFAQGGATATLTGTVVDTSGAVVPGADIIVKNVATGATFATVSGSDGAFTIPAMPTGTYTATVSLQGFKTMELKDVVLNAGVTASVKAVLELGEIKETVVVTGATEIIQTQQTSVAATLNVRQISNLPIAGRGAFDLVNYMPGVNSSTGSARDAMVNGLPQSTVNITLDGMNIQDNYAKSWDGMFTRVSPRLDAVEEVTISTAASGADMAGQGAVQMRMVTRSGTNKYVGSAYYYFRRDWMNTNTWFNLNRNVDATGKPQGKPPVVQYQPGARFGGPIIKDKLFFFVNYEWVKTPSTYNSTRYLLSQNAQNGIFQYGTGGAYSVDLLALARANGQTPTIDPKVAEILAAIRGSVTCATCVMNTIPDDKTQEILNWQLPQTGQTKYPTLRLDYNVTSKHRVSASITQNHLISNPDTLNGYQRTFPGFGVQSIQDSYRWTAQVSLRSVLTKNMVNELRLGGTGGATFFAPTLSPDMFSSTPAQTIGGSPYAIALSNYRNLSNPYGPYTNSSREGSTRLIEDTLSWLKGKHSLSMGASFTQGRVWLWNQQQVPRIRFGIVSGDPADAMFSSANFPNSSSDERTYARNLYALLTGRISSLDREARVGEDGETYTILGPSNQYGAVWQMGFFAQDSWRLKPNLTVNGGLRWEIQLPFYAQNNSYSTATLNDLFGVTGTGSNLVVGSTVNNLGNLFQPGVLQGSAPSYQLLEEGKSAYNTDWNNIAPSIGVAWTVGADKGFWHTLLGAQGDSVIRGGYNIAYQRGGMSDLTEVFGSNPGIQIDATRSSQNGNLGAVPLLLSSGDLSAPSVALTRTYPLTSFSVSSNMRIFDPNIKLPWAATGTIGIQRALAKNMALEVRYIHSDSHGGWTLNNLSGQLNYNEIDYFNTGYLTEFRLAQANLAANTAAGNGKGLAYTGIPGTYPLPIFMAHVSGYGPNNCPACVTDPTKYTASAWTQSAWVNALSAYNPNPQTIVSNSSTGLRFNSTYVKNMNTAGYATNFWVVNPAVAAASVVTNGQNNKYNGIQFIFNRRMSQGLLVQANYTYGKGYQQDFYSFAKPYVEREQTYSNSSAGSGNIRHNFAFNFVYELPFGQGRHFKNDAGSVLNRIIGNWNVAGVIRIASGRLVDFGNVRLIGFSRKDLQSMLKVRKTTDPNNQYRTLVYWLPQDIIDNTIKAYSVTATGYSAGEPTGKYFAPANSPSCLESVAGYGDCGARSVVVTGPKVWTTDVNFDKQIAIKGRVGAQFQIMIFNIFNRVNFNPVTGIGSVLDNYQITTALTQSRTMQLAFRVNF